MRTWYGAVVGDIGTSEGGHDGKIRSTAWQGLLTRSCSWSRMARRDGDGGGGLGERGRRHASSLSRRRHYYHNDSVSFHGCATVDLSFTFKSRLCESSMIRLPEVDSVVAMSRAASRRLSSKKPLFLRTASPMSSAARASPAERTMMACFSCSA